MNQTINILCFVLLSGCVSKPEINQETVDWKYYLGELTSSQYSTVSQITKENVTRMKVLWTFDGGEEDPRNRSQVQTNPLIVGGTLYGTTARLKLIALNARNGTKMWSFDPFEGNSSENGIGVNRGLVYWEDSLRRNKRIYYAAGQHLYCIDASTGELVAPFGIGGTVSLKEGLDTDLEERYVLSKTPGVIYRDKLILGTSVAEGPNAAPGHIRAYNIHTGKREWIFHTIPHPGEFGYETWPEEAWQKSGGANAWAGMSLDEERGIVYLPTGSASYDFYGADRHGENLFANCILALDAGTGERIWHYQTVHHDLWDRDLPAPPNLATIEIEGKSRDVVIQITKSGFLFVLDRDTGEPVFEIEEKPVPPSSLWGEKAWPTQPYPVEMPPFTRQEFNLEQVTDLSDSANGFVKNILSRTDYSHMFLPPSDSGVIIFPGFDGGGEWGGAAFNPETKTLFVNTNEIPWIQTMIPVFGTSENNMWMQGSAAGKSLYRQFCAGCHGIDKQGGEFMGNVPSLVNLKETYTDSTFDILETGRGVMPAFPWLSRHQVEGLKNYLLETGYENMFTRDYDLTPSYTSTGYIKFKDQNGYPAIKPPWGTLTAVDIENTEILWKVPLGEYPELSKAGIPITGTENYGGPVITSNGLLFIAATPDEKFRVFDQDNGKVIFSNDSRRR